MKRPWRRKPNTKVYNFKGLAGCVTQRKARQTSTLVGIYKSAPAGMESDPELPWATVCEVHSTLVCHSSLKNAMYAASQPRDWCEFCRAKDNLYVLDQDPESEAFTLDNFLENNEGLDEYEKQKVADLDVGESHRLGGGAAAEFLLRRVS